MDEKIRLRDDVIFQLKQQMATQQQRIADLERTVNELSIKEEGIFINKINIIVPIIASSYLFSVCACIIIIMCVYSSFRRRYKTIRT